MASLVARTTHSIPHSFSSAVAEIWRSVGGSLSSSVLQHRSYSREALDACVPPSPKASSAVHPLVDTTPLVEYPPVLAKSQTFGGDKPVDDKNRFPPRKWEGFRVPVPIPIWKPQLTRTAFYEKEGPLSNCLRAFSIVAEKLSYDSPRQGFVRNNELPIRSACGGGHIQLNNAMALLKHRQEQGIKLDSYTFVEVLKLCSNEKDLIAIREVHACILESGMDKHPHVANTLMKVYVRCGNLQDARRLFDGLPKKDNFTWSIMIGGYAKNNQAEDALEVFKQMDEGGVHASELLCLSILNACASPLALKWGKQIHAYIRDAGLESDVRVGTALVQMYAKCGCITEARRVFETLTNRDIITLSVMINAYAKSGSVDDARQLFDRTENRDTITWNIIIAAYAKNGRGVEAYELFLQMKREGFKPDAITYLSILNASAASGEALEWVKAVHSDAGEAGLDSFLRVRNALVHMYAKCGSIEEARQVFNRMEKRNVTAWNIMIGAYAESGCRVEAYRLFLQMEQEGFIRDAITYTSILNASVTAGALEWVKEVHAHAVSAGLESDLRVGGALIYMYAKSGSLDDARLVFNRMEKPNLVAWNAMIGGLAQHGCGHEALELFGKMNADSVKPDETSFVAVLSACCHAGLVDDGRRLFSAMTEDFGIEPTVVHYNCMVDLLGRAGHLEEAKLFIDEMPLEPDGATWKALLGACRTYGNVELGELAAKELLKF